jgi:RimJ/RimL family protein N-acetyltransferase
LKKILETERLLLRELDPEPDAGFMLELLNSPKFHAYIGDRGVRTVEQAAVFGRERYCQGYNLHGYGLYVVETKAGDEEPSQPIGICGFVRRETLPAPDIAFAFLPQFERQGYGYESSLAMMDYGRETLGFDRVLAITSMDNDASIRLLEKLGFVQKELTDAPDGEKLRLFTFDYPTV